MTTEDVERADDTVPNYLKDVEETAAELQQWLEQEAIVKCTREGINRICLAPTGEAVQETLFDTVKELVETVAVRLFVQGDNGLESVRQYGVPPGRSEETEARTVLESRKWRGIELARSPSARNVGCFTVPLKWGGQERDAALQVITKERPPRRRAQQAIETVALVAGTTSVARSSVFAAFQSAAVSGADPWSALSLRSTFFERVADNLLAVSGGKVAAVRVRDGDRLRFVAMAGDGWNDGHLDRAYDSKDRSLGWTAVETGEEQYLADTQDPAEQGKFFQLFEFSRSILVVPFAGPGNKGFQGAISVDWPGLDGGKDSKLRSYARRLADAMRSGLVEIERKEREVFATVDALLAGDKDNGLALLASKVQRLLNADTCAVFLPESDEGDAPLIRISSGTSHRPEVRIAPNQGLTGWVYAKSAPLRLRNLRDQRSLDELQRHHPEMDPRDTWDEFSAKAEGSAAMLAIPLVADQETFGVLRVRGKRGARSFNHLEETLLMEIGVRVARALHFQREEQRLIREAKRQRDDRRMQEEITSARDVRKVCRFGLNNALANTAAQNAHIWLDAGPELRTEIAAGLGFNKLLAAGRPVFVDRPPSEPVFETPVTASSRWGRLNLEIADLYRGKSPTVLRSVACLRLPFSPEAECTGTLILGWDNQQDFTDKTKQQLQAEAQRLVAMLEPPLSLERRIRKQKTLREAGLAMTLQGDSAALMNKVIEAAKDWSGMEFATIRELSIPEQKWILRAPLDLSEERMPRALDEKDYPVIRRSADNPRPNYIRDTEKDELWNRQAKNIPAGERQDYMKEIRCSVHVPIWWGGRCIAMIFLQSPEPKDVSPETLEYLEILGAYAAVALAIAESQELTEPLAMMGSLMSGFQHLMRNKINNALAVNDLLSNPKLPPERIPRLVEDQKLYFQDLTNVCQDLGRFTDVTNVGRRTRTDINRAVERTLTTFSEAEFRNVRFNSKQLRHASAFVMANEALLDVAVKMVIQNALEAMPEGGDLTVESLPEGEHVAVSIRDTGVGMDEETKRRCREPFFTTKATQGGTGMGLAVVDKIMKNHKGDWRVNSVPGEGTTVTLLFPKLKGAENG